MDESVKVGPIHVPARLSNVSTTILKGTKMVKRLAKKTIEQQRKEQEEQDDKYSDGNEDKANDDP